MVLCTRVPRVGEQHGTDGLEELLLESWPILGGPIERQVRDYFSSFRRSTHELSPSLPTEVGVPVERNLTAGTVDAMFGVSGSRLRAAGALL